MAETPQHDSSFNRGPRHIVVLFVLLLVAGAIRFYWNDVERFHPQADEGHYLTDVTTLVEGGITSYPKIVDRFLGDPSSWIFPNPLRWGYLGVASLFCKLTGNVSDRALANLSTIAGLLSVLLTWLVGTELLPSRAALLGAALMTTSPLQLALGRRALADELFCLTFLASLLMLLRYLRAESGRERAGLLIGWIVATTLTIAVKEQFLLVYPAVLIFWWLRAGRRVAPREAATWMLPPLLFASVFCLLSGSVTKFFRIAWIITSSMTAPYASQYQGGPPQRLLIDFIAIAPIVTVTAIVAAGFIALQRAPRRTQRETGEWHLLVLLATIGVAHALLPSKNLRYLIEADPLTRLLVASFAWRQMRLRGLGLRSVMAAVFINGAIELTLFVTIFVRRGVYDPVTDTLFRALNMLPR